MKINLIVLKTHQLIELCAFYRLFDLSFEYHQHGQGPFHYSTDIGGIVFEIYPLPKYIEEADITTRLGFEVENLEQLIEKLLEIGVRIVSMPQVTAYGYRAIVEDPDGRKIELLQKED